MILYLQRYIDLEAGVWQPANVSSLLQYFFTSRHVDSPLAPEGDDSPVTLLIGFLLDLGAERDGAHDAITELFVQNGLVGIAVVLDNLEEPVNQWLLWWHLQLPATVWVSRELLLKGGLVDFEDVGKILDVFGRGLGLAIEKGGNCDFLPAKGLGNGLKGKVLLLLGLEQDWGGGWKAWSDGGLQRVNWQLEQRFYTLCTYVKSGNRMARGGSLSGHSERSMGAKVLV